MCKKISNNLYCENILYLFCVYHKIKTIKFHEAKYNFNIAILTQVCSMNISINTVLKCEQIQYLYNII